MSPDSIVFHNFCLDMTQYIADEAHFKEVIARVPKVRRSLWIGTADIKDLYVDERPFLGLIADLIKSGKDVRLIHAKEPGPNFREDFDRYPVLFTGLERALCPRVHFKIWAQGYADRLYRLGQSDRRRNRNEEHPHAEFRGRNPDGRSCPG